MAGSYNEIVTDTQRLGLLATVMIWLHAYSLGGGTYTGIEAVNNVCSSPAET